MKDSISEEKYELTVGRDDATGNPRWVSIRLNGQLQSPTDEQPAHIVYDQHGRVKEFGWFQNNLYHRHSGPALQRINPENKIVEYEEHRWLGMLHRSESEPALVVRDPNSGSVVDARFYQNDLEIEVKSSLKLDPKP